MGPRGMRIECGEGSTMRNFIVCTVHLIYRVIKSRKLRCAGHVPRMEECRSTLKILTDKPTGKNPSGRPRHRREDNIRMYLKEIGVDTRNWVDSAQDRDYWRALLNVALNLRVLQAMELTS